MQQANGILFVVIRAERVGTDHFAQQPGLMGERADSGAHFMQHDLDPPVGGLPGGLGSGHAAADDMKRMCHGA